MPSDDIYSRYNIRPPSSGLGCGYGLGILVAVLFVLGICAALATDVVHRAMYNGANSPEAATMTVVATLGPSLTQTATARCSNAVASLSNSEAGQVLRQYMASTFSGDVVLKRVDSVTPSNYDPCLETVCMHFSTPNSSGGPSSEPGVVELEYRPDQGIWDVTGYYRDNSCPS